MRQARETGRAQAGGRLVFPNPVRLDALPRSLRLDHAQMVDLGGFDCRLELYRKLRVALRCVVVKCWSAEAKAQERPAVHSFSSASLRWVASAMRGSMSGSRSPSMTAARL